MNCKEGDIAVVIYSELGNVGRLVRVICEDEGNMLQPGSTYWIAGEIFGVEADEVGLFSWVVESIGAPLGCAGGPLMVRPMFDKYLRPIRDQPGADETLTWCDVPDEVTA